MCLHLRLFVHCVRERAIILCAGMPTYALGVNCKVKRIVRKYVFVNAATIIYIFRYIKCVCEKLWISHNYHHHHTCSSATR